MQRRLLVSVLGALLLGLCGVSYAKQLGAGDARNAIASLFGAPRDEIRIVSVTPGLVGDDAVVIARVDIPFQLHKDKDGTWRVQSVRLRDRGWEDVEQIKRALDTEKIARAKSDLAALATATEAFRRERGAYPKVDSCIALVDLIAPRYLSQIILDDPWHLPYACKSTATGFELVSNGPDGKPSTADDIRLTSTAGSPQ